MLTSYEEFEKALIVMLRVRSKNYVNTDCDIVTILDLVYSDISSTININWVKTIHAVIDEDIIYLASNDIQDGNVSTLTEEYGVVHDIVDDEDYDIGNLLFQVNDNAYRWKTSDAKEAFIGKDIFFIRPVIYKLNSLPFRFYDKLFTVLVEGVMYHIEASVFNPNDIEAGNLSYQRYYAAKNKLINDYPQVQYIDKNLPVRINNGR